MKKLLNNLKAPITSAIGLVICIVTIAAIYQDKISWQYEGLIGVSTGTLFFLIPDKIGSLMIGVLQKLVNKPNQE